jgi:hypothetical protein
MKTLKSTTFDHFSGFGRQDLINPLFRFSSIRIYHPYARIVLYTLSLVFLSRAVRYDCMFLCSFTHRSFNLFYLQQPSQDGCYPRIDYHPNITETNNTNIGERITQNDYPILLEKPVIIVCCSSIKYKMPTFQLICGA